MVAQSWTLVVVTVSWRTSHDTSDQSCCLGISHRCIMQWYTGAATKQLPQVKGLERCGEERGTVMAQTGLEAYSKFAPEVFCQ